jgi:hypothetical protein
MKREACPKIELLDTTRRAFNSRQVRARWRVPLSLRQVKMNPDSCYGLYFRGEHALRTICHLRKLDARLRISHINDKGCCRP